MGNFHRARAPKNKGKKPARTSQTAINGVPVVLLQLADNLSTFRGAQVFGYVKDVYSAESGTRAAKATRHNAGDRGEIRRRLEALARDGSVSVFDEIGAVMEDAVPVMFLTGDTKLQRRAVTGLLYAVELAQMQKVGARRAGDCDQADFWFGQQSLFHALAHIIEVWLDIKSGLPRRAWIHKVDAEDYLRISRVAMVHCGLEAGRDAIQSLEFFTTVVNSTDNAVFPPLQFGSSGFTYTSAHCSVCGEDLSLCPHIEGRVYCGKYCTKVRLQNLAFDHFARVDYPHDRRSVFLTASDNDVCRDAMTGEVIRGDPDSLLVTVHGRLNLLPDIAN